MTSENLFDVLKEILAQMASETVRLLPKVLIALIVIVMTFLVIKVLNIGFRRLLKLAKLDVMFKQFTGFTLPFSLDSLIIFLADLGIALIALHGLVNLFLGSQYLRLINDGIYYAARVVSIVVIAILIFAIFNMLISRIKVESRLRSYAMLIVLLLITAMLIDITALSDQVKNALTLGLSIGVGIAIGVFATWFFFHEYLDKKFKIERVAKPQETREGGDGV